MGIFFSFSPISYARGRHFVGRFHDAEVVGRSGFRWPAHEEVRTCFSCAFLQPTEGDGVFLGTLSQLLRLSRYDSDLWQIELTYEGRERPGEPLRMTVKTERLLGNVVRSDNYSVRNYSVVLSRVSILVAVKVGRSYQLLHRLRSGAGAGTRQLG